MASLIAKVNRGRSAAASAKRSGQHKKAGSKKATKEKRVSHTEKPKRAISAKPVKRVVVSKKGPAKKSAAAKSSVIKKASQKKAGQSKKPPLKKTPVKQTSSRPQKASLKAKPPKSRLIAPPPIMEHPKPVPSANTLAAVRAFEQALKVFNRHDFPGAKVSFENILEKYVDQAEVAARVRTYLAICEQRLSRIPSVPKSPDALYDQGVFEFNKGNAREAISFFERAIKVDQRADHIWYSLAAAHARLGNSTAAIDALRRAIILRPVHRSHVRRDPDFSSLRDNVDFQLLAGVGVDFI